jgi:two-component system response regulator AtoC
VRRLLEQPESRYDALWLLTIPTGEGPARALAEELEASGQRVTVRLVDVADPSDYGALFRALGPLAAEARRTFPAPDWSHEVLLSAGTPQCQTLWVILVQAGILPARMLQVVPSIFVRTGERVIRDVLLTIEGFPEIRALRREVSRLREQLSPASATLLGESTPMVELRSRLTRVARSQAAVLVLGETGTGKELVARAVHAESPRAKGPFIAENCGVFAEGVLASELFGHEPGAFTGATTRRKGVFEQAHGGTLFLDEVGELSPRVQAALLRVLQESALRRVGGETKVPVDVRVIAATHRDLPRMIREGTFREDLYFRLRGATLEIPPLRARPGDVELLVRAFLERSASRRDAPRLGISREALRALSAYRWPGNVRELEAEVERWAVFCEGVVDERDLAPELRGGPAEASSSFAEAHDDTPLEPLAAQIGRIERAAITEALRATGGNLSATARALGIDRNTLKRKRVEHGV